MIARIRYYARWVLCVLLLFAGVPKLLNVPVFAQSLRETGFFAEQTVSWLAWSVPVVEIAVAACLGLGIVAGVVIPVALALSVTFTGVHAYAVLSGTVGPPCGCLPIVQEAEGHGFMLAVSLGMALFSGMLVVTSPFAPTGLPHDEACATAV